MCCCSVIKLHLTLFDLMDCSSSGFSVYGIFQARILGWVAISFSRGSSQTQRLNLCLLHWQADPLLLSHHSYLVIGLHFQMYLHFIFQSSQIVHICMPHNIYWSEWNILRTLNPVRQLSSKNIWGTLRILPQKRFMMSKLFSWQN